MLGHRYHNLPQPRSQVLARVSVPYVAAVKWVVWRRFLTRGTRLMIHSRQIHSTVELSGPLKMQVASLKAKLHEIEESMRIEEEGFRDIIAGSRVPFEDVCARAPNNWYIEAEEARDLGLVLDVI